MNRAVSYRSPAKLNLFLHITGRRPDGYHQLQTVFQLIDLCDTLTFTTGRLPAGVLSLRCDQPEVPLDNNLILKAARRLRDLAGQPQLAAEITLQKRIPMGGGLGGGSSNAAVTLLALNELWSLGLSRQRLMELGLELGADVPVFVLGKNAWAAGVGEELEPLELPSCHYLILWPRVHVATGDIFSHQQLTRDSAAIKIADFLAGRGRNDCEKVVRRLYPEVDDAMNWLNMFGQARLTGTGSCVFASFDAREDAGKILDQVPARFKGYVASGLNCLPEPSQA
ncbi:MAG: 4-(cytidine 5'-diphospho)-2-C-methyl-D-erythritol kinase [Gammaproteobacteria bacterium]|nr:4-(cytidine 5'-diphospho)-2-C-methyl-D-erythritol kinase [Gammaproteobacteria bacterium]